MLAKLIDNRTGIGAPDDDLQPHGFTRNRLKLAQYGGQIIGAHFFSSRRVNYEEAGMTTEAPFLSNPNQSHRSRSPAVTLLKLVDSPPLVSRREALVLSFTSSSICTPSRCPSARISVFKRSSMSPRPAL